MREVIWEVSDCINSYNCILIRKRWTIECCFLTKIVSTCILARYFLWPAVTLERFCIRVRTNPRSEVWTHSFLWWVWGFFWTYKETCTAIKLHCILSFRTLIKGIGVQIHFSPSKKVHALVQERCHNKLAPKVKWQNSLLDLFVYRTHIWVVWATGNILCYFLKFDHSKYSLMNLNNWFQGKWLLAQWSDAGIKCIFIFCRLPEVCSLCLLRPKFFEGFLAQQQKKA